jgi:hypothetical protein
VIRVTLVFIQILLLLFLVVICDYRSAELLKVKVQRRGLLLTRVLGTRVSLRGTQDYTFLGEHLLLLD